MSRGRVLGPYGVSSCVISLQRAKLGQGSLADAEVLIATGDNLVANCDSQPSMRAQIERCGFGSISGPALLEDLDWEPAFLHPLLVV